MTFRYNLEKFTELVNQTLNSVFYPCVDALQVDIKRITYKTKYGIQLQLDNNSNILDSLKFTNNFLTYY